MQLAYKKEEICSVCETEPEDMLILSCRHNLCLNCATEVYNLNSKSNQIICEICLSQTQLDCETVVCLRSLSAKSIKERGNNPLAYDWTQNREKDLYPPIPIKGQFDHLPKADSKKQQIPSVRSEMILAKCEKHNESLTYYCLDCSFYKICSECMLLENHRYHKVITLKKAYCHIKQTIQRQGQQRLKLKSLLQHSHFTLQNGRKQSESQLSTNLLELKNVFDEITKVVGQRYDQLKREMESEAMRKLQIMDGAMNEISQKIDLIEETIEFESQLIRATIRDSQCGNQNGMIQMFQYYQSQLGQDRRIDLEPRLPNFIEQVANESILKKGQIISQLQSLLNQITFNVLNQEAQEDENINCVSQIGNDQAAQKICELQNKESKASSVKKKYQMLQDAFNIPNSVFKKKSFSQNINIIQMGFCQNAAFKQRKDTNINPIQPMKKSKQSIEAIKRKARSNLRDRQLSNSRKMQLSRSIENATDILNKIQERSSRV